MGTAPCNVPYVPSAALIVRTELARFDEALRYGEDVDLVWRLHDAGHRVIYDPTSSSRTRSATASDDASTTARRRRRCARRHPTRLAMSRSPRTPVRAPRASSRGAACPRR